MWGLGGEPPRVYRRLKCYPLWWTVLVGVHVTCWWRYTLELSASHPFEPIKETASFYRWPSETREPDFSKSARLHGKCVIADRPSVLITSANFTSAGIKDDVELGILIERRTSPAALSQHLEELLERGIFEKL